MTNEMDLVDLEELTRSLEDLSDVLVGLTTVNIMCPSCGYVWTASVRNSELEKRTVTWTCKCGKGNKTTVRTNLPIDMAYVMKIAQAFGVDDEGISNT